MRGRAKSAADLQKSPQIAKMKFTFDRKSAEILHPHTKVYRRLEITLPIFIHFEIQDTGVLFSVFSLIDIMTNVNF